MNKTEPRHIRTGGDPRPLPDFASLRDEMHKLTHPARPDVDWAKVESLSLSLLEKNGAELQTMAWYTLARSHLTRINGMNEGLAVLNAILSHQWTQCWPSQPHARAEILSGLSQRLQKVCRTFTLSHDDLPALQEAETQLQLLNAILGRHDLKQVCQLTPLEQQIRRALTRLENSARPEAPIAARVTHALAATTPEMAAPPARPLVYVIPPTPEANVQIRHEALPSPARWPAFMAGVMLTCLVGGVAVGIHHWQGKPDVNSVAMNRSLAPLPEVMSAEQLDASRQTPAANSDARRWIKRVSTQLEALSALPPDWSLQYGHQLLTQAESLWPGNQSVMQLRLRWQQQLIMSAIPDISLTDWQQGMEQLRTLAEKLNALDGQRGKYLTVSELKSQVFGMLNRFQQTVPMEEQLRQIKYLPVDSPQRQQLIRQAEQHLRSQTYTLAQEKYRN